MKNIQADYNKEFEEISGVRNISSIVKQRRDAFEHALIDIANDKTMGYLVAFGNKHNARPDHGLLGSMILDLRDFQDKFLQQQEGFFDSDAQKAELQIIFAKTMQKVIAKWPMLSKEGYNWNSLCGAISKNMENVAKVFGLSQPMEVYIVDWFDQYKKGKNTEQKYQERDELNQRVVRAYSELAYLSSVGADVKVMDQVRHRIAGIDKQLTKLPVDQRESAIPAFSKSNHQQIAKVVVDQSKAIDRKVPVIDEKAVNSKKSFWQKLKFWEK